MEKNEKIKTIRSPFYRVIFVVIFIGISFLVTNFIKTIIYNYKSNNDKVGMLSDMEGDRIVNENANIVFGGEVKGESSQASGAVVSSSENFKIKQLSFGADIIVSNSGDEGDLEISDIRSESFMSNKKDESRLVISWKTNKMAISDVEYSKNSGKSPKTIKEESYGFTHSISLAGLEPSTPYAYKIKCTDRWGNETSSDYFGIYTASKPVSVFDLISRATNDTFGWTMGK